MAKKRYPSDLSDREWDILKPLIPPAKTGGCPRSIDMGEIVNAIFFMTRGSIPWRYLPKGLPHGKQPTITSGYGEKKGSWRR